MMIVTLPCLSFGQSASKSEQEIISLDHHWARAIERNDSVALARILANDIVAISANGVYKTKRELIAEVKPPPELVVDGFSVSDVKARTIGDGIITNGKATLDAHAQSKPTTNHFLYTHVYTKRHGRWQIINLQMTRAQAK